MDCDEKSEVRGPTSPLHSLGAGVGMVGAERKPELAEELEALDRVTNDVKKFTSLLSDKLTPIVRGANPTEARAKTPPRETAVAQNIRSQVQELINVRDDLKQILNRLEL